MISLITCSEFKSKPQNTAGVLNMDVHWVIQGFNFDFQGFFIEILGFSSSLIELIPHLRLLRSSYRKSFDEPPVLNETFFYNQSMFPKEAINTKRMISTESPIELSNINIPICNYFRGHIGLHIDDFCLDSTENNNSFRIFANTSYINDEVSKSKIYTTFTAKDCCHYCFEQPLCLGWTFDMTRFTCNMKYQSFSTITPEPNLISGNMMETSKSLGKGRRPVPRAIIYHGTSCFYQNISVAQTRRDVNTILIGRYMVERASVSGGFMQDDYSVLYCASFMDEIWVPTEWHKEVVTAMLAGLGFSNPMIAVIPEAVDTELFDPKLASSNRYTKFLSTCTGTYAVDDNSDSAILDAACQSSSPKFEFLSIFKWEYRKGYDLLLNAYWTTFSRTDAVVLRIRSYVPASDFLLSKKTISTLINEHALKFFGKDSKDLAEVIWEGGDMPHLRSQALTRMEMRQLYALADAFVLPTRGEGWGLPIAEAMAMEVPVIVTNHSGPTAYCTADNSYLIPVDPEEMDELSYAKPDVLVLGMLMKQVIKDSQTIDGIAAAKGRRARKTMERLSPRHAVSLMVERLRYHAHRRGWTL